MTSSPRLWATLDPFVESGAILGRKVANTSFLRALLTADPYDGYHFYLPNEGNRDYVAAWMRDNFPAMAKKIRLLLRPELVSGLVNTPYHCMHLSDAVERFHQLERYRNAYSPAIFPITGLTHSLSYADYAADFSALVWNGVSTRDAVIVTSESARLVMERFFALTRRSYGLCEGEFPSPSLPRIPLGVPEEGLPRPEERWNAPGERNLAAKKLRNRHKLGDKTIFLCLSRFSPNSKMDLLPLFAAFRRAHDLGLAKERYALILAGWADKDDALPESLAGFARGLGIDTRLVLRPTDEERRTLYAAADVFVSPSDNIQETFGLTVAEAITASLPVIASEFDGYRDSITPECGILVPTTGFAVSAETDTLSGLWHDSQYHLKLAQQTVVDVPALAAALHRLGTNAALARAMGEAGRQRALARYTWETVIKQYVALWDALAAAPLGKGEEERLRASAHPQGMRFAEIFAGHFSRVLDEQTLADMTLLRTPTGEAVYRGALPIHHYSGMEHIVDAEAVRVLLLATRKPEPAAQLMERLRRHFAGSTRANAFTEERAAQVLLWALKQDYVEKVCPSVSPSKKHTRASCGD